MNNAMIIPPLLQVGDKVALIAPCHQVTANHVDMAVQNMQQLGLVPVVGEHVHDKYGYFAGKQEDRLTDFHHAIADDAIRAVIAIRGGSGAASLLDHLDYGLIRSYPKIIMGLSDVTSLLWGITQKTGLISFHGPVAKATMPVETKNALTKVLFEGDWGIHHPRISKNEAVYGQHILHTINPGRVSGRLWGGNLSVMASLLGSDYLPDWSDVILFFEDVNEEIYRIERLLIQLKLNGVLDNIKGLVIGQFNGCKMTAPDSFVLEDVIDRILKPLQIPMFAGAMIGHQDYNLTLPIGMNVILDADTGTLLGSR